MPSSVTFAYLADISLLNNNDQPNTLEFRGRRVEEDLACGFGFDEVSHLPIWDHLPSSEEKHRFRYELALASRNIAQSVVDVVGSLP